MKKAQLTEKLDVIVEHITTAEHHHKNQHFADALTNMRKAAEDATYIILFLEYNVNRVHQITTGKGFGEIIEFLQHNRLIPLNVLNWFEAIRINGNLGAHTNNVSADQSEYSMYALKMLIQWLYEDKLKAAKPRYIENWLNKATVDSQAIPDQFALQHKTLQLEKELLEQQLQAERSKQGDKADSIDELKAEIEKTSARIEQIASAKKLEKDQEPSVSVATKTQTTNWLRPVRLVILLGFGLSLILIFVLIRSEKKEQQKDVSASIADKSFNIGIARYAVIQDNPNTKLSIEEVMESEMQKRMSAYGANIEVGVIDSMIAPFSDEEAQAMLNKLNIDILSYGQLFEPSGNESFQINQSLAFRSTQRPKKHKGLTFSNLNDTALNRIYDLIECDIILQFSEAMFKLEEESFKIISLLEKTNPITHLQRWQVNKKLTTAYLKNEEFDHALHLANDLRTEHPDSVIVNALLANIFYKTDAIDSSIHYAYKTLGLDSNHKTVLPILADLTFKHDLLSARKSLTFALKTIAWDSTNLIGMYSAARANQFLGNYHDATNYYEHLLTLDANNTQARFSLIHLYKEELDLPEKGLTHIEALEAMGMEGHPLVQISRVKLKIQQMQKIAGDSIQKDPYYQMAYKAYKDRDYEAAISSLMFVPDGYLTPAKHVLAGNCHLRLNQPKMAKEALEKGLAAYPNHFDVHLALGSFYTYYKHDYQDINKGIKHYELALQYKPDCLEAIHSLGNIYVETDLEKALFYLELAVQYQPENLEAIKTLAIQKMKTGKLNEALPYFKRIMEKMPYDQHALADYAGCYMAVHKKVTPTVLSYITRALEIDRNDGMTNLIYAEAMRHSGRYHEAEQYYRNAVQLDPSQKSPNFEKSLNRAMRKSGRSDLFVPN